MRAFQRTQAKGSLLTALSIVILVTISTQGRAHAAASPLVSNQASSSGYPVGGQIYDSAMLGNGQNPTGSLIFNLYGPGDANCTGPALLTTSTPVNGNGYYESSRYVSTMAGSYQWTVSYSGDANNSPSGPTVCSDSAGEVAVAKRTPLLDASPVWTAPATKAIGNLVNGVGPSGPTGNMTFRLYGANNMTCAGAPIFTHVQPVSGNGGYTSAPYNPTVAGTYQWIVTYSGDANNQAMSSTCSDTSNGFTMAPSNPAAVSGSPTTIARGGTVTARWSEVDSPTSGDWVGLYKTGTADGGSVMSWKYTGGGESGSVSLRLPWGATPGTYEVRLMANNTIQRLATSAPITLAW